MQHPENVKEELQQQQQSIKDEPELEGVEISNSEKGDLIEFLDNNTQLLTCRVCYKVFTTVEGLRCHKRIHTGSMFKCKVCDKEYTRQNHLARHELTHSKRKVHVCKICSKTLTRFEHLKRHLTIHLKEKPFACAICNRGFNRQEHLMNHVKRCKGDRIYICDICNKGFNREDSLEVHRKMHENKMPVLPTLENLDNIDQHYFQIDYDDTMFSDNSDNDDNDTEDCFEPQIDIDVAESQLAVQPEETKKEKVEEKPETVEKQESPSTEPEEDIKEKENIEVETKDEEDEDDAGNNYEDIPDHESDSNDSEYLPFKPAPPKIKRGRGRPRKHAPKPSKTGRPRGRPPTRPKIETIKEEDEEGEFPCEDCKRVFHQYGSLKKHRCKSGDLLLKMHTCTVCNKTFARGNHLRRHMISHSDKKPHCCQICPKSFSRKDHLVQHVKLHSRAQEFQCDICKRPFTRPDQLAKHKASKHNVGEKVGKKCFIKSKYIFFIFFR